MYLDSAIDAQPVISVYQAPFGHLQVGVVAERVTGIPWPTSLVLASSNPKTHLLTPSNWEHSDNGSLSGFATDVAVQEFLIGLEKSAVV